VLPQHLPPFCENGDPPGRRLTALLRGGRTSGNQLACPSIPQPPSSRIRSHESERPIRRAVRMGPMPRLWRCLWDRRPFAGKSRRVVLTGRAIVARPLRGTRRKESCGGRRLNF
jgi:hypothetical protein